MALTLKDIEKHFRVPTNGRFRLKDHDTAWAGGDYFPDLSKDDLKERARSYLTENLDELEAAQQLLWATDCHSVLVVLQAMDAAGKDGTIKHVMSGVNPQGCQVFAFKKPSDEEVDHTFLWRYMRRCRTRTHRHHSNRLLTMKIVLVVRVQPGDPGDGRRAAGRQARHGLSGRKLASTTSNNFELASSRATATGGGQVLLNILEGPAAGNVSWSG
jgi:hypothetical protein